MKVDVVITLLPGDPSLWRNHLKLSSSCLYLEDGRGSCLLYAFLEETFKIFEIVQTLGLEYRAL